MSMRAWTVAALLLAAAFAFGEEPEDPHGVPREQIRQRVRVIALMPVTVLTGAADRVPARERFEPLLAAKLEAKGYRVVPSAEFARVWRELSERVRGVYDPVTGRASPEKGTAVGEHTRREMERRFGVNAFLASELVLDDVVPGWNASGEYVLWGEPILLRGRRLAGGLEGIPQRVQAAVLDVDLIDVNGADLYHGRSGVEWIRVYAARGHDEKPPASRFRNAVALQNAVDKTLDPLVSR
jgi:hypothetical protein